MITSTTTSDKTPFFLFKYLRYKCINNKYGLKLQIDSKAIFIIWFFVLWIVTNWALLEFTFPRNSYMPFMLPSLLVLLFSISSFLAAIFYFRRNIIHKRSLLAVFATVTVILTIWLTPNIPVAMTNKSKVQWYIDDLRKQGFEVIYGTQYPYNRGQVTNVYSYSNFTSIAKELNCTYVLVYGGAPLEFVFFFPSETDFLINEHGQYLLCENW